jgi:D-glycero-D-manno-heptose 1,7-bisphosphate phosphatase
MSGPLYVLLDRDGTVIHDKHYLADAEGVELLPGAAQGLGRMVELGCRLVLVTNQSGVNRGYFGHAEVEAMHQRLDELLAPHGVHFEAVYYCPHTPEEDCPCRKPEPRMVHWAMKDLGFAAGDCLVIGDKRCDLELGRNVGARTMLVRTGKGAAQEPECGHLADWCVDGLVQAAAVIEAEVLPGRASS